jgi:glycosyltransferase involved in cell wall biosynthesis
MRVALLGFSAPAGDAIGHQLAEKLTFFLERGADVRAFLESDHRLHPACRDLPVRVHEITRARNDESQEEESWEFLETADLIIVDYSQFYDLLNGLPLLAGGKARIVLDYHSVTPPRLWGDGNREAIEKGARQRGLAWCADAVWVHSGFAKRELLDATGFPESWVHRLGFPVDFEHFSPGLPRLNWRERLGLGDIKLLLFVGRLAPNKRVPILIETLALLKETIPAVHAMVVGDNGDVYAAETKRCQQRAAELHVCDRLHLLGRLGDEDLLDAYRSADVFVMPSVHEGFCLPVLEAMACGVPVVAARAAALPETVASAGLTFIADDAADLTRQVRRVLTEDRGLRIEDRETTRTEKDKNRGQESSILDPPSSILDQPHLRVAFVAFRFGSDFVGGAEASLRTAARALRDRGHHVEIFTTCTQSEGHWTNELSEGTGDCDGMPLHRFRIDPHDRERHLESIRIILQAEGRVTSEIEEEYLKHSIHSTRLVEELGRRQDEFDAIIAGPYLHALTYDLARELSEKAIVVPCFHDEPFARFLIWPIVYGRAGGIWYHSEEEKKFAEAELGLNHPGGECIGTWLDTQSLGDGHRGRQLVGGERPYLVYCGRFSQEKDLPTLLDFARRYNDAKPGQFHFVFLGEGSIKIPDADWAKNLGYVEEAVKRDLLAGATALIQLSRYESLSLVALEAWVQGTPVLADRRCPALAGHLRRCGGGQAIDSFESFAAALDDLWENSDAWQNRGRQGQEYVRDNYGCRESYASRLEQSIHDLRSPLADRMRKQGLKQAGLHSRSAWRTRVAALVEEILDCPRRPMRDNVEIVPRTDTLTVSAGQETVLVPVRLSNRGTHAVVAEGPGRSSVESRVVSDSERKKGRRYERATPVVGEPVEVLTTPLPDLLMPGQTLPAAVLVPVPKRTGSYRVLFHLMRPDHDANTNHRVTENTEKMMELHVEDRPFVAQGFRPLLDEIRAALVEASRLQRLPDDYTDVTEGRLARWKRWIKRKLLGNFKHAYVDVLSRQQSRFNQKILTAVTELADYCATLEHAAKAGTAVRDPKPEVGNHRDTENTEKIKIDGFEY